MYDDIFDTILFTDKKLLQFKLLKLGHTVCVDKTGFLKLGGWVAGGGLYLPLGHRHQCCVFSK